MCKKNISNRYKKPQKSTVSTQNRESFSIRLNNNSDAWLISYATSILDLIKKQEAVQFVDDLIGDDEARNHCILDEAHRKSQEFNQTINSEISQMAQFQAFTMAGLQAKARVLKAISSPLAFDEGFISYEVNMLFTSLLMDTLAGVQP
ncbi:hypothetical protein [Commensalibacter nepenthis]|uniref:Uncharacterized protein n=1 Tax=Commensalibacter nepenthis TaxID=3043872 RepID=A0ABT6QAJ7_9PROT|nr:hypothetical protein [Commensalibacter sp. TBRC 10068]MDI2113931.1 hypothetical protein [Commensalibacter sp. TBRC 10068]